MLAIKPQSSLKDARQYFKEHLSVGDYYTQGQQALGHWFGQGAQDLGLSGVTHLDEFVHLLTSRSPIPSDSSGTMSSNRWSDTLSADILSISIPAVRPLLASEKYLSFIPPPRLPPSARHS